MLTHTETNDVFFSDHGAPCPTCTGTIYRYEIRTRDVEASCIGCTRPHYFVPNSRARSLQVAADVSAAHFALTEATKESYGPADT